MTEDQFGTSRMRTVVTFVLLCLATTVLAAPEAITPAGTFRGRYLTSFGGRQFTAFSGIPYARPPVGLLRFKDPEPMDVLDEIYDATAEKDDCIQIDYGFNKYPLDISKKRTHVGSEDCLYLNVYTPDIKPDIPYPVIVWIHGGAFLIGSGSSELQGPELIMDRDVVFVSINYRLGPFGFLSLDDDLLPGNLGLKDQSTALSWIQRNIKGFGGDPAQVTISGESAGGASVHLQMHSPLSRGKFIRAISQSGTIDCSWAMHSLSESLQIGKQFTELIGCPDNTATALDCMRGKTAEEILLTAKDMLAFPLQILFKPVIEKNSKGAFLTQQSFNEGSEIPWISGVNSGEGLIIYGEMIKSGDADLRNFQSSYNMFLPHLLSYNSSPDKKEITKKIVQHYLKDRPFTKETLKEMVEMFSYGMFNHGLIKSSKKHKGPMYSYYFTHEGERRFNPLIPAELSGYGVDHADELLYLLQFKKFIPVLKFNEADQKVSNLMLDLWTNFATYGNPTPKGDIKWPESEKGQVTAEINSSGIKVHRKLLHDKVRFWENLEKMQLSRDEL